MWSFGWLDDLFQTCATPRARCAWRSRRPWSHAALGIGNTAIFSVVLPSYCANFRTPIPTGRLDLDRPRSVEHRSQSASFPDVADWRAQNTVFTDIGAYAFNRFEITDGTGRRRAGHRRHAVGLSGARCHAVARASAAPDEDHTPVVAISYRLWQRRRRRPLIGRKTTLDEVVHYRRRPAAGFHFRRPTSISGPWPHVRQGYRKSPGSRAAAAWLVRGGVETGRRANRPRK